MTLAVLPAPSFTGADLSTRLNAALTEARAARRFASLSALLADSSLAYGAGARPVATGDRLVTAEGHRYEVAASGATDHHLTTAGGVRLRVLQGAGGWNVRAFGTGAAAIQGAVNAAAATGGDVWMPDGAYDIGATTIAIPAGVGFRAAAGATVTSTATGTAFEITGSEYLGGRQIRLPNIRRATLGWFAGSDTSSVGVQVRGIQFDQVFLHEVSGFYKGLEIKAVAGSNAVCNTIHLGRIINCHFGLFFDEHRTGVSAELRGANQNTFIGGSIRIDTSYRKAGPCLVQMGVVESNGNTFLGVNLEGAAGGVKAIHCNSINNSWIGCRYEGNAAATIEFAAAAVNNRVIGGNHSATGPVAWDPMVANAGFGNRFDWSDGLGSKHIEWDFNTGQILFGNGTAAPAFPVAGYGTNRLQIGSAAMLGTRHFGYLWAEEVEQTSGTTVPNNCQHINLNYASPATITGMAGGAPSDLSGLYSIFSATANVTLQHTAAPTVAQGRFVLKAGANKVLAANSTTLFRLRDGNFYEV